MQKKYDLDKMTVTEALISCGCFLLVVLCGITIPVGIILVLL